MFCVLFVRFQISLVGPVSPVKQMACPSISRITPEAGILCSTGIGVMATLLNITRFPGVRARYCTGGFPVCGASIVAKSGQTVPLNTLETSRRSEEHTSELQSPDHLV